jgi:glycosyltransferase involved in cell wall biosynthesis
VDQNSLPSAASIGIGRDRLNPVAAETQKPAMRLSVVEPSGQLYGSELALLDILEALDRSRFSAEVVLPAGSPFSERLRVAKVPFLELLRPRAYQASRLKKLLTYWRLAVHWRRQRPDLIYVNQGGILRPIAAIGRRLALPVLCQVQTLEDARWVSSLTGSHAQVSAFVCNSRFIAESTNVPREHLCMVYHGYKPKGLRQMRPHATRHPIEVGLLGRICEGKGHYLVVEAAQRLKALDSADFHFRFIGDAADEAERKRIRVLVESCGLQQMIELRGYRSNIGAEFEALDLLTIPSFAEPLGRVFFEAAEARLPVLVANQGGLGEVSQFFGAGVQFQSGSVDDFLHKLQQMAAHYEATWEEFNEAAGRMLARLKLEPYIKVIEQILEGAAAGQPVSEVWLGSPSETEACHP